MSKGERKFTPARTPGSCRANHLYDPYLNALGLPAGGECRHAMNAIAIASRTFWCPKLALPFS